MANQRRPSHSPPILSNRRRRFERIGGSGEYPVATTCFPDRDEPDGKILLSNVYCKCKPDDTALQTSARVFVVPSFSRNTARF